MSVQALKFLFANRDGVFVELEVLSDTKIWQLKAFLIDAWPDEVPKCTDPSRIRLICMGIGILPDKQTIEGAKVPKFDDHPTPINVSVRPIMGGEQTPATATDSNEAGGAADTAQCCCVLM